MTYRYAFCMLTLFDFRNMTHMYKHFVKFHRKLDELRFSDMYCDVTIVCEETSFRCHRAILAAACPYFHTMFSIQMRESAAESVVLPQMNAETFREVLQFVYTGDTAITSDNICNLIVASDFLNLESMEDLCVQYIQEGSQIKHILKILSFAYAVDKLSLVDALVDYVVRYFKQFLESKEFCEIPFQFLHRMLINPKCVDKLELSTFARDDLRDAIIRWIKHSEEERLSYIDKLIELGQFEDAPSAKFEFICALTSDKSSQTEKEVHFESLIAENENLLSVFIKFRGDNEVSDLDRVKVYQINKDPVSVSMCKAWVSEFCHTYMKCVAINNSSLYCLNYSQRGMEFSISSSVDMRSKQILKSPPHDTYAFDLHEMQNNVLLYDMKVNDLHSYNRELDEWFPVPQMKKRKKVACVTVCNDTDLIYVIGGGDYGNVFSSPSNTVQVLDYRVGKWWELPQTITKHMAGATCSYRGKIYVISGASRQEISNCEVYNPVAGKWELIESPDAAFNHHRLIPYENELWVVGGMRNLEYNLGVHIYNPVSNKWRFSDLYTKFKCGRVFDVLDSVIFQFYQ